MGKKLNKCLSCGQDTMAIRPFYEFPTQYWICCSNCFLHTSKFKTEKELVEYWNSMNKQRWFDEEEAEVVAATTELKEIIRTKSEQVLAAPDFLILGGGSAHDLARRVLAEPSA